MRVLALSSLYPRPGHELMASFNRQQFRTLAEKHDVRAIVPVAWHEVLKGLARGKTAPARYRNDDGIEVEHPIYYYPPRIATKRYGQFYHRSVRVAFERAVAEFAPDVVLACWAHPDGWAAVQLAREAGLPVVTKVVGSDVLVVTRKATRMEWVSQALRQADAVVAVSRDLADHVEYLGADPRRVHVVPEGIDRELFSRGDQATARERLGLAPDEQIVLFVGNLLFSKGVGVLVEALTRLAEGSDSESQYRLGRLPYANHSVRCYLVGPGRDERKLRAFIAKHRLNDCVQLVDGCTHETLVDWYRACDVVALPSFSEGIPNVLREAMECGRPFVATDVGGIPEIAHPSYGRLVPAGDAGALAAALAELLAKPPDVDPRLVRERNVSWHESAEMLVEVLDNAIQSRKPRVQCCWPREESSGTRIDCRGPTHALRILAITNQYPRPAHDTLAAFNRQQFCELAAQHELRVVAPVPWPEEVRNWLRCDVRSREYRTRDGIWVEHPRFVYPPKLLHHRHGSYFLRCARRTVQRAIREFHPDVVLGTWAYPDGWAAVHLAREAGLPVVIKAHGSDVLVLGRDPARRKLIAETLTAADRVVVVSGDLARNVIELGVSPERISVVRNGIDSELFSPGDQTTARQRLGLSERGPERQRDGEMERGRNEERVVLFVGNLLLSKGAGVLVEACKRLTEGSNPISHGGLEGPAHAKHRFHCYLVGAGKDAGMVRRMIARYRLDDCVKLVGSCPHARLVDWYRACDVVVLPSFSEGLTNVLQEVISCGRPFVATRVGGIPELAHPSYSRLVSPGNAEELADALAAMLANPLVVDPALVAEQVISWQRSAESLAEVLEDAVGRNKRMRSTYDFPQYRRAGSGCIVQNVPIPFSRPES